MGQRVVSMMAKNRAPGRPSAATPMPFLGIFPTEIGWMGLVGRENHVERLIFGHSSPDSLWEHSFDRTRRRFYGMRLVSRTPQPIRSLCRGPVDGFFGRERRFVPFDAPFSTGL